MSGGHYEYMYFKLAELADYIENDFVNDGKYMGEDWSLSSKSYPNNERPIVECDRLEDANKEEKEIILKEKTACII